VSSIIVLAERVMVPPFGIGRKPMRSPSAVTVAVTCVVPITALALDAGVVVKVV
jgi:hypothetical protein